MDNRDLRGQMSEGQEERLVLWHKANRLSSCE
jgi:hypothetical protein